MFLLDTNDVSEIARADGRTMINGRVASWIERNTEDLWLSVVTAAEIEDGIAKASRTGATRKAGDLRAW
jgi:predicted nucleic acid-binding protein